MVLANDGASRDAVLHQTQADVAVSGAPQPIIELVQFTICEPKFNSKVDRSLCGAKIS